MKGHTMTNGKVLHGDFFSGLFFLILGIYILRAAIPWGLYGDAGPGPGFFPVIYSVLMMVLGLALLGRSLIQRRTPSAPKTDNEGRNAAIMTWIALASSIPLMIVLGFLGGFGLLALFITKVIFKKSWIASLVAAIAIALGLYLLFQVALEIDLPTSLLLED
jgi:putative tricarboxylic transport membrane protein